MICNGNTTSKLKSLMYIILTNTLVYSPLEPFVIWSSFLSHKQIWLRAFWRIFVRTSPFSEISFLSKLSLIGLSCIWTFWAGSSWLGRSDIPDVQKGCLRKTYVVVNLLWTRVQFHVAMVVQSVNTKIIKSD